MSEVSEPGPRIVEQAPPPVEPQGFHGFTIHNDLVLPSRTVGDDDAKLMAEHLAYEIEQLAGLWRASVTEAAHEGREWPRGSLRYLRGEAVVAAFLLHARLLDEVLYRDTLEPYRPKTPQDRGYGSYNGRAWARHPNDVVAWDFVEDVDRWLEARPARAWAVADQVRTRSNRAVLHLTWSRVVSDPAIPGHVPMEKRQTYDVSFVYNHLNDALRAWLPLVRPGLQEQLVGPALSALDAPLTLKQRDCPDQER